MSKLNQSKKIALFFALLGVVFIFLSYVKISSHKDESLPESNGKTVYEEIYEEIKEDKEVEDKIDKETDLENDSEVKEEIKSYYEVAGDNNFTLVVDGDNFPALFDEGDSIYEAMSKMKDFGLISFEEKSFSGLGVYIYSINNISENKREGKYWIDYVNDVQANVGVSNYYLDEGDEIRWQLETNTY